VIVADFQETNILILAALERDAAGAESVQVIIFIATLPNRKWTST